MLAIDGVRELYSQVGDLQAVLSAVTDSARLRRAIIITNKNKNFISVGPATIISEPEFKAWVKRLFLNNKTIVAKSPRGPKKPNWKLRTSLEKLHVEQRVYIYYNMPTDDADAGNQEFLRLIKDLLGATLLNSPPTTVK